MASLHTRILVALVAVVTILPGCDSNDERSDIGVNVAIEGTGTGRIEGQTIGLNIECRVEAGVVSGTCSTTLQDNDGGTLRLESTPDPASTFTWDGDCRGTTGRVCELSFAAGQDAVFDVVGRFQAKTVRVAITPKPITMTTAGEDGAVIAQAQALDENDAEVFGVDFTWATSNPNVVTVTPLPGNRSATLIALQNGSAIISATAQGVTGQTQVDVTITN